ncbi:DUF5993 family protein [Bizionia sediminis]|uniref:DUF5993 family protein n=1 Tax=Bizionia sediminis TaxID=1737064 RepID=A0ABW5KR44_9FLAO
MSLIFLTYFVSFLCLFKQKQKLAYIFFALASVFSIVMFLYHSSSTLNLSF